MDQFESWAALYGGVPPNMYTGMWNGMPLAPPFMPQPEDFAAPDLKRARLDGFGDMGLSQSIVMHQAKMNVPLNKSVYWKTRMCSNWTKGQCDSLNCNYAHGVEELRVLPPDLVTLLEKQKTQKAGAAAEDGGGGGGQHRNALWKTKLCNVFMNQGICPRGPGCCFAHGMDDLRPPGVATNAHNDSATAHPSTKVDHAHPAPPSAASQAPSSTRFDGSTPSPGQERTNAIRIPPSLVPHHCGRPDGTAAVQLRGEGEYEPEDYLPLDSNPRQEEHAAVEGACDPGHENRVAAPQQCTGASVLSSKMSRTDNSCKMAITIAFGDQLNKRQEVEGWLDVWWCENVEDVESFEGVVGSPPSTVTYQMAVPRDKSALLANAKREVQRLLAAGT